MNFEQIIETTKEKIWDKAVSFLFDSAIRSFSTNMSQTNAIGWEKIDLKPGDIHNIFLSIRWELQMEGAKMSNGSDSYDNMIYDELTQALSALREVLTQNFSVKLPESRVASITDEMCEGGGPFEQVKDKKGQKFIRRRKIVYDLKIKIIKTPIGPMPEEFRQKWPDCRPLAAYRVPRTPGKENVVAHLLPPDSQEGIYKVRNKEAIAAMREISAEAADWLLKYFGEKGNLIFRLDEAEIVPTKRKRNPAKK